MLTVLGKATSINVRKVMWTCEELGIPFTLEEWGTGFRPTDDPNFLALNPNAMVPVIQDKGFVLWESNSIIRYLANHHNGEVLYPVENKARAIIDQWIDWQASTLNPSWSYAFQALVRRLPNHQDPEQISQSHHQWSACMAILDAQLQKTKGYVAGEVFSLADIPIGLSVNRWFETPVTHPHLPALNTYYDRLAERSGFLVYGRNGIP
ncbi:glutathione S-transferase [Pseudomonas sp. LTJR-52]|uniref:glutathione S-transferase family protein n=1 Tax=Pseudomonas sp. LTJR-52 TaxID=2479392 RepID=UPI000EFBF80B|nr:glutathione S-transferase [Pseudomonas sp. LTJR-52]AYN96501.1 glutathione S-transferase [Pseudomonas sp. LTJR-52]